MTGLTIRQHEALRRAAPPVRMPPEPAPMNHRSHAPREVPPAPTVIEQISEASDSLLNRTWFVAGLGTAIGAIFAFAAMGRL